MESEAMSDTNRRLNNGRYILQQKLGDGGMGVVHCARDRLTGNIVALKQVHIPPQYLQFMSKPAGKVTQDLRLSLAREFQTLATLRHPHIISVLDYGFVAGKDGENHPFYTMTYLPQANTLLEARARLSVSKKLGFIQQTLQGLAYLHRRGILHRDLKPENVLMVGEHVRILDFGLSTQRNENSRGYSGGSALYLSPELWHQQPASSASDLYALGVMAFELLSGQHPFAPLNHAFIDRVLNEEPDWQLLDVPEVLVSVIAGLLAKEPEARTQQAQAVLADLSVALGQPLPAESVIIRESYLRAATFVGRKAELVQLSHALQQVVEAQSALWLIGGESGVGKTRLLDELRIQALTQGFIVLRGQAVAGGGLPFHLWREPIRRLLLLQEVSNLQARILKDIVPDIECLLDQKIPDAPPVTGAAYQQRLIRSIVDLFRDLPQPVLLILEDLQWTGESLIVLQRLQRVIERLPHLLVLGSYRDDERPTLADEMASAERLHLARLDEAAMLQLSAAMLGKAGQKPEVTDLLLRKTEGNVFFVVEVVRALAEEAGSLAAVGEVTLPTDVFTQGMHHILQRRIQQVPSDDQALLQLAAVVGRQLDWQLLALWADARQLEEWLQRCAELAILSLRDETWFFTHDKLRETILSDLQTEERPRLHRQVAEAIEQVYPEDANYDEVLLEHWHQAGNLDKEIHYLNPVAQRLVEITADYERARVLLERGLQTLPETDVRSVILCNWLALSHERQGQYSQAQAQAQKAWGLATQLKDQPGIAQSLQNLGRVAYSQGDYEQAQNYYQQSLSIQQDIGDQRGIATSLNNLGLVAYRQGDYAQARENLEHSLSIYRDIGDQRGIAYSLNNLGLVAYHQGDYEQAWDYYQQSLSIRHNIGDQRGIARSLNNLGEVAYRQGDYPQAWDYYQQSFSIYRDIGDQQGTAISLSNLGEVAYYQDDYEQAQDYYQQSFSIYRDIGDQQGTAISLSNLGKVAYRQADYGQVQDYYQQSFTIAHSIQAIPLMLMSLLGFAWLYLQGTQPVRAGKLCGLVQHHPAFDSEVQIRLDEVLPLLQDTLSAADLETALACGKSLNLDSVVAELLVEFGEDYV
ncbi:MAG: tetratricopeptide repeat protein [Gammaproteobacteria bacterium]|nr:tetratricopeptide repeat protein [Gammaproteobacteria bacterium]